MTTPDRQLARIAERQHGIVSRHAAHAAGVTNRQLRSRVSSGTLIQTGSHTFRPYGARHTPIDDLRVLIADLGVDAVASGRTAAALHGFDGHTLRSPFDVTIVRNKNMRRIGHFIHTTHDLELIDRAVVQGCPTLSGARTLIDLAKHLDEEELTIAYDCGRRDGLFSTDLLHRRVTALRSSGRGGIPKLLSVIEHTEIVAGAHSWLEREFLRVTHAAGLALPQTQQVLSSVGDRLVRVDFRYAGTPLVVEVLGYRYHRTATHMRRDAERQNALLRDGFIPYQYTYDQVVNDTARMVSEISAALTRLTAA